LAGKLLLPGFSKKHHGFTVYVGSCGEALWRKMEALEAIEKRSMKEDRGPTILMPKALEA